MLSKKDNQKYVFFLQKTLINAKYKCQKKEKAELKNCANTVKHIWAKQSASDKSDHVTP